VFFTNNLLVLLAVLVFFPPALSPLLVSFSNNHRTNWDFPPPLLVFFTNNLLVLLAVLVFFPPPPRRC